MSVVPRPLGSGRSLIPPVAVQENPRPELCAPVELGQ